MECVFWEILAVSLVREDGVGAMKNQVVRDDQRSCILDRHRATGLRGLVGSHGHEVSTSGSLGRTRASSRSLDRRTGDSLQPPLVTERAFMTLWPLQ